MAEPDRKPVTMEELLVSSLAQTDALAKILNHPNAIRTNCCLDYVPAKTFNVAVYTTTERYPAEPYRSPLRVVCRPAGR